MKYLKDFSGTEIMITNQVKTHALYIFRQITKLYEDIIPLLSEEDFTNKLLEFCKSDDRQLCNEGWKTFYHLISYHSGVLELLIENKNLYTLISLISVTSSNIIIEKGFHYLTKMFEITPKRKSKSVEQDIKTLALYYIEKKMYINCHLIFQRFEKAQYPGKIFFEMINFFDMLFSNPSTRKIWKDILKNTDFKLGIDKLCLLLDYDSEFDKNSKKRGRGVDWH